LKKIGNDDHVTSIPRWKKTAFRLFPQFAELSGPVTVSSLIEAEVVASAFDIKASDAWITGSPRNDKLMPRASREIRRIAYLPTHRGEGVGGFDPLSTLDYVSANKVLERIGAELYIKKHFYHASDAAGVGGFPRIKFITNDDIDSDLYNFLNTVDLLITDYSSVYLDYLITGRPIVFAPFDIDDYMRSDREFNWPYEDVTPGPHCGSWIEVFGQIEALASGEDHWLGARASARALFHSHVDGGASERIYRATMEAISSVYGGGYGGS